MRFPVVVLDGLGDSIEVPLLSSGIVSPSLQPDIVGTMALDNSVEWKFGDKVEWSVDVESEFFVESLGSELLSLVNIDDLPFLISSLLISVNNNCLSFIILGSCNRECLVVGWVDELVTLIFEHLKPSGVG
jgi:hypothetical protein